MLDPEAERELVRRLRDGRRESFEALLDAYETRVYNLALRMLGAAPDAEDATQETFIQVNRALPSFRGEARLETWIVRIAMNVCLQRRRKLALPVTSLDEETPALQPESDPYAAAVRSELGERISAALHRLPDGQREVALLHGMQGLSYAEVAEVLGCPVGTVKSRLSAAFKHLRRLLGAYAESAGYVAAEETLR